MQNKKKKFVFTLRSEKKKKKKHTLFVVEKENFFFIFRLVVVMCIGIPGVYRRGDSRWIKYQVSLLHLLLLLLPPPPPPQNNTHTCEFFKASLFQLIKKKSNKKIVIQLKVINLLNFVRLLVNTILFVRRYMRLCESFILTHFFFQFIYLF